MSTSFTDSKVGEVANGGNVGGQASVGLVPTYFIDWTRFEPVEGRFP